MKQGNDYADYSYCHVVGQTDVGRKRKANEDNGGHFITINGLVSVVCDGMGGHVGGAVASQIAIETIREFLECQYYDDPREAIGLAIQTANETIIRRAQMQPDLNGMGSTCVLLLVRDGKVYIGHVGDSRIYLIREKNIIQLTKDHSFVQSLVDMGHITKEEAEHHPRKNEITNALGIPQMTPATVRPDPIEPQAGDCFLLCSDGLSGMVNDKAIERIVSKQREYTSQQRADILVQTANANGGVDNITVELVEFAVSPAAATATAQKTLSPKIMYAVLTALVLLCAGVCAFFLMKKPSVETKYMVLSDIEIVAGDTGALFKLTPKEGDNYVFANICHGGSVRDDLNDVVVDSIKTNLVYSESGEFTIPAKFGDDSVYVLIPCRTSVHRYSAKLVVKPSEQLMNEVKFKSNGEVAQIILSDDKQKYIMSVTGNSAPKIIEAKKFTVSPAESVKTSAKSDTTVISFGRKFIGEDIRITFETEVGDKIFVIPVTSPSARVLPIEDQKKNEHKEVPKSEDKKPVVPEEIQDIIVELELTECADKVIEITAESVNCGEIRNQLESVDSVSDECELGELKEYIEFEYREGECCKLKFKDSPEAGTYVITFPCRKNGKEINLKLTLNIK